MKKFLKKNKLPLFLLAAVLMLSIYYSLSPTNKKSNNSGSVSGSSLDNSSSYIYFDEERLNILEERNNLILSIENNIATQTSVDTVVGLLSEIEGLYNLTNKECSLESEIEALGYTDVLVHSYDVYEEVTEDDSYKISYVDIKILCEELSEERGVAITQLAKTKFGSNSYKVNLILETND